MIRNHLPEIMKAEGITAYQLTKILSDRVARNTVYRWARGKCPLA